MALDSVQVRDALKRLGLTGGRRPRRPRDPDGRDPRGAPPRPHRRGDDDPQPRAGRWAGRPTLDLADILTPNRGELAVAGRRRGQAREARQGGCSAEPGDRAVLVSLGAEGALLVRAAARPPSRRRPSRRGHRRCRRHAERGPGCGAGRGTGPRGRRPACGDRGGLAVTRAGAREGMPTRPSSNAAWTRRLRSCRVSDLAFDPAVRSRAAGVISQRARRRSTHHAASPVTRASAAMRARPVDEQRLATRPRPRPGPAATVTARRPPRRARRSVGSSRWCTRPAVEDPASAADRRGRHRAGLTAIPPSGRATGRVLDPDQPRVAVGARAAGHEVAAGLQQETVPRRACRGVPPPSGGPGPCRSRRGRSGAGTATGAPGRSTTRVPAAVESPSGGAAPDPGGARIAEPIEVAKHAGIEAAAGDAVGAVRSRPARARAAAEH